MLIPGYIWLHVWPATLVQGMLWSSAQMLDENIIKHACAVKRWAWKSCFISFIPLTVHIEEGDKNEMPLKVTFFFSAFHASHFLFSRGRWKSVFSHISHYLNLMRILMRATAHFGGSSHNVALASWLSGCQSCLPAKVAFSKNPDHSHLLKVYKVPGKSAFISIHLCKTHTQISCMW